MRINPSAFGFSRNNNRMQNNAMLPAFMRRNTPTESAKKLSSFKIPTSEANAASSAAKLAAAVEARRAAAKTNYVPIVIKGLENAKTAPEALLFNFEAKQTYTKEDALAAINRGSIIIDDDPIVAAQKTRENNAYIQANGITNSIDLSMAEFDMKIAAGSAADSLRQDVDYFASRYVAIKDRMNREYTGAEQEENLDKLEKMMNTQKDNLARTFADSVGGILEKNGATGESEHIYNSVLAALDERIAQFADFTKANPNYADINGVEEEKFRKDSAYMASEMRIAMNAAEVKPDDSSGGDLYSVADMEKLQAFVQEMSDCYSDGSLNQNRISDGFESEESLGMKLGALALKAEAFKTHSGVSDRMKDTVTRSVNGFITNTINAQQAYMDKWSEIQRQTYESAVADGRMTRETADREIAGIDRRFAAFDGGEVREIINKMAETYLRTNDAAKAILDGASAAMDRFTEKIKGKTGDEVGRYKNTSYWNNFMQLKDKQYGGGSYIYKQSGLDGIIGEWNNFMRNIGADESTITIPQLNAWA